MTSCINESSRSERLLIDANELARRTSLGRRTIERLTASNAIPGAVKIGGSRRYVLRHIEEWIARGCPRTHSPGTWGRPPSRLRTP